MEDFAKSLSVQKLIGAGGFGRVFLAQNPQKENFVIKCISKTRKQTQNIVREVQAGNIVQHKNIVNFIAHYEDESSDYLVFDYVKGIGSGTTIVTPVRFRPVFIPTKKKL